jgi:hypothetical protein
MKILRWLSPALTDRHYEVRCRELIPAGSCRACVHGGSTVPPSPCLLCIVATIADGRVTRVHEYLDPAGVAALANAPRT